MHLPKSAGISINFRVSNGDPDLGCASRINSFRESRIGAHDPPPEKAIDSRSLDLDEYLSQGIRERMRFTANVWFGFLFVLTLAALIASLVLLTVNRRQICRGKSQRPCPSSVFDVTSQDLWPCQASADLRTIGLSPSYVSRRVPTVFPWDPKFNTLRLNVALQQQRLPLFIVRPRCAHDVAAAIRLAQKHALSVSVKSGGHCNEAFSIYNPIVIAISSLGGTQFNCKTGVLSCGGGITQGQLFRATADVARRTGRNWAFPLAQRHHGFLPQSLGLTTGTVSDVGL